MKGLPLKQFIKLDGKPVILRTLEQFNSADEVDCIITVVGKKDIDSVKRMVVSYRLSKVCGVVSGGNRRQDSVWNGLKALKRQNVDVVLVHDAVRPFVSSELIRSVARVAARIGAVIPAVSPKDTIKCAGKKHVVESTLQRDTLWAVQTPQAFQFALLYRAFEKARADKFYGTDDASLVERLGVTVKIVDGCYDNIKITTPEDLELAQFIAKRVK